MTDAATEQALRSRYQEVLAQMQVVHDLVAWWKDRFPNAAAARALYDDYQQVFIPTYKTFEQLERGEASWSNNAIPDILENAAKIKAAAWDHTHLIAFQASCAASEDEE